uniref:type II toxin-antitoxin system RelE/ParE family toxin n=1 Tax=Variovorax paradoxus TaxID=34073 RepID=UPI0027D776F6|nr:type II toxin-antitoxin system RelE/ParE family toxin [Variovorax paradoxus]
MPALEWRVLARADLLSIVDYIPNDNPDAAQRLRYEIEVKAAKLPEHPRLYRSGRVAGTREMVVRSYVVVYAEDARANIVQIGPQPILKTRQHAPCLLAPSLI